MKKVFVVCAMMAALGFAYFYGKYQRMPLINGDVNIFISEPAAESSKTNESIQYRLVETVDGRKADAPSAPPSAVPDTRVQVVGQNNTKTTDSEPTNAAAYTVNITGEFLPDNTTAEESDTVTTALQSVKPDVSPQALSELKLNLTNYLLAHGSVCNKTRLLMWHSYTGIQREALALLVDIFNQTFESRNGCHLASIAKEQGTYSTELETALLRARGPDIFIHDQSYIGTWVEAGEILEPVTHELDGDNRNAFESRAIDAMSYKKEVYGLPIALQTIALIYNKALTAAPTQSTDELKVLAAQDGHAFEPDEGLSMIFPKRDLATFAALQNGLGGGFFDMNGQVNLRTSENNQALELLQRLYMPYWLAADTELYSSQDVIAAFNEGYVKAMISDAASLQYIHKSLNYGVTTLPVISDTNQPMQPWLKVDGVFLNARSKRQAAALDVMRYLASPDAAKLRALLAQQVPVSHVANQQKDVLALADIQGFRAQADQAKLLPNGPLIPIILDALKQAFNTAEDDNILAKAQVLIDYALQTKMAPAK